MSQCVSGSSCTTDEHSTLTEASQGTVWCFCHIQKFMYLVCHVTWRNMKKQQHFYCCSLVNLSLTCWKRIIIIYCLYLSRLDTKYLTYSILLSVTLLPDNMQLFPLSALSPDIWTVAHLIPVRLLHLPQEGVSSQAAKYLKELLTCSQKTNPPRREVFFLQPKLSLFLFHWTEWVNLHHVRVCLL